MCCYDEDCYFVFVCKWKWKWHCSIYLFLYVSDYCKDVGGCSSETCRKCKIFLFCFFSFLENGLNLHYFNVSLLIFNVKIKENFFLLAKNKRKYDTIKLYYKQHEFLYSENYSLNLWYLILICLFVLFVIYSKRDHHVFITIIVIVMLVT